MTDQTDVLRGTLDLMILKALADGPMHGYGVVQWIRRTTEETLMVEDGALYPALHRLRKRGLITSDWGRSENNRRARYYRLTQTGRRQLETQTSRWDEIVTAVNRVLRPAD